MAKKKKVESSVVDEIVNDINESNVEINNEDLKLFDTKRFHLRIYELIVNIDEDIKKVVVKNNGGGDLYIDSKIPKFDTVNILRPNEEKEFIDIKNIFLISASRPKVIVEYYK